MRDEVDSSFERVFFRRPLRNEKAVGRALLPLGDFRVSWEAACCTTSLGRMDGSGKGVKLRGLLYFDLRRSAIRNMLSSGVHSHAAMKISGHLTDSVFRRYNIVDERDLHEAAKKVGEYLSVSLPPTPTKATAPLQELVN